MVSPWGWSWASHRMWQVRWVLQHLWGSWINLARRVSQFCLSLTPFLPRDGDSSYGRWPKTPFAFLSLCMVPHTKVMIFWEGAHIQAERRGLNAHKEAHRYRDTQIVFQIQLNIVVIKVKMQRNYGWEGDSKISKSRGRLGHVPQISRADLQISLGSDIGTPFCEYDYHSCRVNTDPHGLNAELL